MALCSSTSKCVVRENNLMSYTVGGLWSRELSSLGLSLLRATGTHLRMGQSGFRPDQQQAHQGANYGWQGFFAALEGSWRG